MLQEQFGQLHQMLLRGPVKTFKLVMSDGCKLIVAQIIR
jgi:hypothetical protein